MTKFKCAENSRDFVEVVRDKEGRPALTVGDNHSASVAFFAPSDAPALCLAILEAAGGRDAFGIDVSNAMTDLREYVKEQEREAAAEAEADRVALEAEALVLHNAFCSEHSRAESFDEIAGFGDWLAVARAARELNKEDGR